MTSYGSLAYIYSVQFGLYGVFHQGVARATVLNCNYKIIWKSSSNHLSQLDLSNDNFIAIIIEFFPLSIIAENP